MNTIRIQLVEGASDETIARAHAAIDAFTGRTATVGIVPGNGIPLPTKTIEQVAGAPVELDSAGLPWHADIHASTKTQTKAGEWTKRKGADDATIARVMAELRAMYPAPTAPVVAPVIPTIAPHAAPVVTLVPKTEYQKLVDFIATNVSAGKIEQATIDATFDQYKTTLAALAGDEESSKAYREAFETFLAG